MYHFSISHSQSQATHTKQDLDWYLRKTFISGDSDKG